MISNYSNLLVYARSLYNYKSNLGLSNIIWLHWNFSTKFLSTPNIKNASNNSKNNSPPYYGSL